MLGIVENNLGHVRSKLHKLQRQHEQLAILVQGSIHDLTDLQSMVNELEGSSAVH